MKNVVYLDHAASSWPKPDTVLQAMNDCITNYGANPGRGSHSLAIRAGRTLYQCRTHVAELFRIPNPNNIFFTLNTTMALNQAIRGFVKPGQHVICTAVEHNSVRRPLEYLKMKGEIDLSYVPVNHQGKIKIEDVENSFQSHTSLFVCNHSSNLLGTILPLEQISEICKRRGVRLLVDAAQTAGHLDIDVVGMNIDMLAFPGHKGLLGPQGTGGLYVHPELDLEPLMVGGTGSQSEKIEQPDIRPDRYESGTPNTVGIAGLSEGVKYVLQKTVKHIYRHEWELIQQLMEGLQEEQGIQLFGPGLGEDKTGIVALNIHGADSAEIAWKLDKRYNIAVRSGYHCTPLAHDSIGTMDNGAVRVSVGAFTTTDEIDYCIRALKELNQSYR